MSAEDFALVFDDPAALEQRKEEERKHRLRKAEEEKAHQTRLQAEREAAQKAAQEAEAKAKAEAEARKHPPQPPDPLLRASSHAAGSGTHPRDVLGDPVGSPPVFCGRGGPGGGKATPFVPPFGIDCTGGDPRRGVSFMCCNNTVSNAWARAAPAVPQPPPPPP